MAQVRNLVIDQGTTFSLAVNVTDVNGAYVDLTGYTHRAQLRKSYGASSSTQFTTEADDPENGGLVLSLTATQTTALRAGRYVYDIEIEAEGEVTRVLEGIITVTPEVTR